MPHLRPKKSKQASNLLFYKGINGGQGGIRTLDTLRYTHFPGVLLRPLGHLTILQLVSCESSLPTRRELYHSRVDPQGISKKTAPYRVI